MLSATHFFLLLILIFTLPAERRAGHKLSVDGSGDELPHLHSQLPAEEPELLSGPRHPYGPELELSGVPLKTYAARNGHNA